MGAPRSFRGVETVEGEGIVERSGLLSTIRRVRDPACLRPIGVDGLFLGVFAVVCVVEFALIAFFLSQSAISNALALSSGSQVESHCFPVVGSLPFH